MRRVSTELLPKRVLRPLNLADVLRLPFRNVGHILELVVVTEGLPHTVLHVGGQGRTTGGIKGLEGLDHVLLEFGTESLFRYRWRLPLLHLLRNERFEGLEEGLQVLRSLRLLPAREVLQLILSFLLTGGFFRAQKILYRIHRRFASSHS